MEFFKKYLREHRAYLWSTLIIYAVFMASFGLYGFPIESVIYPTILSMILVLIMFAIRSGQERKDHKALQEAALRAELLDLSDLPPAKTMLDEDLHEIIRLLKKERADAVTMANTRYQELSEYYTCWAHQIKTPIASMKLKLSAEDSDFSRSITTELNRIEQYVDMVMTYVRLGSDSTDYVFVDCNLNSIIKGCVKRYMTDFISKKLTLDYEPKDVTVLTDEKWLGFVIGQILSNALKYTRKGGITIAVDTDGEYPVVSITDTGIGISDENLPRVFEMGFTGYNGRSDNKSSGIGLYLCKRICDKLGTDISIESKAGEGTCVKLEIRRDKTRWE